MGSGNNATILVALNGASCCSCSGLRLNGHRIHVLGLAIYSFQNSGIVSIAGTSDSNYIYGNYIGTDAGGMAALGNGGWGVQVDSGYAVVGNGSPSNSNVISNNVAGGVTVNGDPSAALIAGNQIGG